MRDAGMDQWAGLGLYGACMLRNLDFVGKAMKSN